MKRQTLLLFAILLCAATGCDKAEATHELAPDCSQAREMSEFGTVAVSDTEVARSPLGIEGPRLVGCLHNKSDEALDRANFAYSFDGGGGQVDLQFSELAPGETTPFVSESVTWPSDGGGVEGDTNLEFSILNTNLDNFEGESPLTLQAGQQRPDHDIEETCATKNPADGNGEISLSDIQFNEVSVPGGALYYAVGCITNGGDEPIARDQPIMGQGYQVSARHNYANGGGMGSILVDSTLDPGESAFFVYENEFDEVVSDFQLEPTVD